ncbi:MAG TPA: hypothetical protein PLA50_02900 [Bacteroidia bacterium]|nr:hypothetical protein [Bacteroidia bacterium]
MSLPSIIADRFDRSFALYRDLIESIDEEALGSRLPGLPSNTVGLQLWCVVGARESFALAIQANEWSGFSCSLDSTTRKTPVAEALRRSSEGVSGVLDEIGSFTETQNRLIVDLLEHEAAHQGQLIRYLYGLRLAIPDSWKVRYALA